jgi:cytochrome oxidase Cu insertion factor (SCO1/SenC/PrrC family)
MLKKIFIGLAVIVIAAGAFLVAVLYIYPKAQIRGTTNQSAPDFTLTDAEGKTFTLSAQRGQRVVLYFYRGYW